MQPTAGPDGPVSAHDTAPDGEVARPAWATGRLKPVYEAGRAIALLVSFGLLGLLWMIPAVRRRRYRRAAHCRVCARRMRLTAVLVPALSVLLLGAAAFETVQTLAPQISCGSRVYNDGEIVPGQPVDFGLSPSWTVARSVLVAPTSGLALAGSQLVGMSQCRSGPHLVTFWRAPLFASGGTAVGETFVSWMRPATADVERPQELQAIGIAGERPFIRFGPNIASSRLQYEQIALHESRHVDQWAVFSAVGGPGLFPAAYYADTLFFPFARNHFERDANLHYGDYAIPTDFGPAPLWGPLALAVAALLLLCWTRVRWLIRVALNGTRADLLREADRCLRHSSGGVRAHPARVPA